MKGEGVTDAGSKISSTQLAERGSGAGPNGNKGRGGDGTGTTEGRHPRRQTNDGAQVGVTATAVANALVVNPIFLLGKGEGGKGGSQQVRLGVLESVQCTGTNP